MDKLERNTGNTLGDSYEKQQSVNSFSNLQREVNFDPIEAQRRFEQDQAEEDYKFLLRDNEGLPITDFDDCDKLKNIWEKRYNIQLKNDISQPFANTDFIANFIRNIPQSEWKDYIIRDEKNGHADISIANVEDPTHTLVFRRAISSDEPKPEVFWTTSFKEVSRGLNAEIRDGQRHHSEIMVTTLDRLQKHGITTKDGGGVSAGEVVIDPTKPFDDFLFIYKPYSEQSSRDQYLKSGGQTKEELLKILSEDAIERLKRQGLGHHFAERKHEMAKAHFSNQEDQVAAKDWVDDMEEW